MWYVRLTYCRYAYKVHMHVKKKVHKCPKQQRWEQHSWRDGSPPCQDRHTCQPGWLWMLPPPSAKASPNRIEAAYFTST